MKKADVLYNMINLAIQKHKGQIDRYGNQYVLHPLRVMSKFWDDIDCAIVAIGHDLLEDTDCTIKDLDAAGCSFVHTDAIQLLTRDQKIQYSEYINNICKIIEGRMKTSMRPPSGILAAKVKIQDMKDNMSFERSCGESLIPDNKVNKFPIYRESFNKLEQALRKSNYIS